jgi:hypothetical protein
MGQHRKKDLRTQRQRERERERERVKSDSIKTRSLHFSLSFSFLSYFSLWPFLAVAGCSMTSTSCGTVQLLPSRRTHCLCFGQTPTRLHFRLSPPTLLPFSSFFSFFLPPSFFAPALHAPPSPLPVGCHSRIFWKTHYFISSSMINIYFILFQKKILISFCGLVGIYLVIFDTTHKFNTKLKD